MLSNIPLYERLMIAFYSEKLTEHYKVYGNVKVKAKHHLKSKNCSKLYKFLNKNDYKFVWEILILLNKMFNIICILTF